MKTVNDLCRDRYEGAPQLGRCLDGFRVRCAADRAFERGLILHVREASGATLTAGNGVIIRWSAACPSGETIDADNIARELYETCGKAAIVEALIAAGEIEPTEAEVALLAKTRRQPGKILVPVGCGR